MKIRYFFLLLVLPLAMVAQKRTAVGVLEQAVNNIEADAAVQMDYYYKVLDDDNTIVQQDDGIIRLDGNKYALIMDNMKVWCNGKVQWSYMADIDEIYITDAASDEAQNLSPLGVMEMYRTGYSSSIKKVGNTTVVTLDSMAADAEIGKVELCFPDSGHRLGSMTVYMNGQGRVEVQLKNYSAKCKFGKKQYECQLNEFPSAEVVDMR